MARSRTWTAAIAVVCAFTLTAGLAACSSSDGDSSGGGGNTTGVTDTSIRIGVAVSDLDGLRAAGMALAPALTTQNLSKRLTSYFDEWNAAGGINGRQDKASIDDIQLQTSEPDCVWFSMVTGRQVSCAHKGNKQFTCKDGQPYSLI